MRRCGKRCKRSFWHISRYYPILRRLSERREGETDGEANREEEEEEEEEEYKIRDRDSGGGDEEEEAGWWRAGAATGAATV